MDHKVDNWAFPGMFSFRLVYDPAMLVKVNAPHNLMHVLHLLRQVPHIFSKGLSRLLLTLTLRKSTSGHGHGR